ncbi:MAG: prepilin-type N-terminal cleavage/methylation domain-containing protein [Kiritimatiellia bacterium]|nr:prepilin-type N-terminal cleavage/methylation domain-containing protein [Kiritimatiellia bacterium]
MKIQALREAPRGNLPAMLRIALQAGPRGNPPLADRVFSEPCDLSAEAIRAKGEARNAILSCHPVLHSRSRLGEASGGARVGDGGSSFEATADPPCGIRLRAALASAEPPAKPGSARQEPQGFAYSAVVKPLATKAGLAKKGKIPLPSTFSLQPSAYLPNFSAFSLIELVVVTMIIGIMATVAIIKFTGVDSENNRVAANELRSHLTYIRNMAMNREHAVKVQFNKAANNYEMFVAISNWTGDYQLARDPVTQNDWIVDLNSKFSGVSLSSVNINGNDTLYFSETNGMPFDAAWVPLTKNGIIAFKNSAIRVRVIPVTGYIDLMEKTLVAVPVEPEPIELEPLP